MEKKPSQRRLLSWWTCLENEFDNKKVVSVCCEKQSDKGSKATGNDPKADRSRTSETSKDSEKLISKCFLIKETLSKLSQFINTNHKNGCSDPHCIYSKKDYSIKIIFVSKEEIGRAHV